MSFIRLSLCLLGAATLASAQSVQSSGVSDISPTIATDVLLPAPPSVDFLGAVVAGPIDVQTPPVTDNGFITGVQYAFGFWWVLGGDGSSTVNGGMIYKYDLNGVLLAEFPQNSIITSTFCHRDGAVDEFNSLLYFGEESNRIVEYHYDAGTGNLTNTRVLTLTNPGAGGLPTTVRALARNPLTGRFYTANFGSTVFEFVVPPSGTTATVTTVFANPTSPATAFFGMAWNKSNNTLWGWSQNGIPAVRADEFAVGLTTIVPTGTSFQGVNLPVAGPIAGGCDLYNDPRNPGFLSLATVHQSTPDAVVLYDTAVPYLPPPFHDTCANAAAFPCGSPPATVSTLAATLDPTPGCGPIAVAPGVWFKIAGSGEPVTLSTCDAVTNFDTRISVYSGACGALTCIADNDDAGCGANPLASSVSFSTNCGEDYLVLVHGGKVGTDVGTFRLSQTCRNYCIAGTTSGCSASLPFISRVTIGAIDNATPGCSPGGYQRACASTPMAVGCPVAATVQITNSTATDKVRVWVDWNQDSDFTDPGEEFALSGTPPTPPIFTGFITPPAGAALGVTRMRVGWDESATVLPCGLTTTSDFEDYLVDVTPIVDSDFDGTADCVDGCPLDPLKVAAGACGCGVPDTDTDNDGTPDCFDNCPTDPNKVDPGFCGCNRPENDPDGDGVPSCIDDCPFDPNKIAPGLCGCGVPDTDTDSDGVPDCFDACPTDPAKVDPGFCGCGQPETDTDADGLPDCVDGCPLDPLKGAPGFCGCGNSEFDGDGDGFPNCVDNCPNTFNPGQEDTDFDGRGDLCDNCPLNQNPGQQDCDFDGIGDVCEIANGLAVDCNTNGIPDNCETDCNQNGVTDDCDVLFGASQDLNSNGIPDECEGPGVPFCFGDGLGTPCPCANHSTTPGQGCRNSTGSGGQLYNSGSTSVALDDSRLTAFHLPPNARTVFLVGQSQANGGLGMPFYDGLLCISAAKRYPRQTSDISGLISIVQPVALTNGLITPGSTWYFQTWVRDGSGGPCGFLGNLTNGLGVTFTP